MMIGLLLLLLLLVLVLLRSARTSARITQAICGASVFVEIGTPQNFMRIMAPQFGGTNSKQEKEENNNQGGRRRRGGPTFPLQVHVPMSRLEAMALEAAQRLALDPLH